MKTLNDSEKKMVQEYHKLFDAKRELHKLMRRVVVSTKLGRQIKQPDDDIDLEIGNGILGSCARYGQVRYYPLKLSGEYQLEDDAEIIEYIKEKKKFARKYFQKPLVKVEGIFAAKNE